MTTQPAAPGSPRRGRGRPRVADIRVTVGLPAALYAEIQREAEARGLTVSQEVRRRCEVLASRA